MSDTGEAQEGHLQPDPQLSAQAFSTPLGPCLQATAQTLDSISKDVKKELMSCSAVTAQLPCICLSSAICAVHLLGQAVGPTTSAAATADVTGQAATPQHLQLPVQCSLALRSGNSLAFNPQVPSFSPLHAIQNMLHPSAMYIFICRVSYDLTCCPDPNPNDITLQPQTTGCDLIVVHVQT